MAPVVDLRFMFHDGIIRGRLGYRGRQGEPDGQGGQLSSLKGKKALFIIASSIFRDEEYQIPRKVLEEKGAEVEVASSRLGRCTGKLGLEVASDLTISQVDVAKYDIIAFVGGAGASEFFQDPVAHRIAQTAVENGKVLGAICIAPATLANAGVLSGRRATVFPSEIEALKAGGAVYTGRPVEIDEKIITANGPEAARDFGKALAEAV